MSRVVVIGGGVIGLSVAAALRRSSSASVVLVERSRVGSGSSAELTGGFRDMFVAPALVGLSQRSIDLLHELRDAGSDLGWNQCGYLYLGTEERQFERLPYDDTKRDLYRGHMERLTPTELSRRFPWLRLEGVHGGAFYDYGGVLTPRRLIEVLTSRCEDAGVEIREGTSAESIALSGGRVTGVTTTAVGIAADVVVLATGGWTGMILSRLGVSLPILPKRGQLFYVTLPPSNQPPTSFVHDYSIGGYLRPGYDGAVLGGYLDSVVAPDPDPKVTTSDGPRVVSLLAQRFPAIANAQITLAWAGNRDVTPDDHGVIDAVPTVAGLFVAAGFGSHGTMHALGIGDLMAALISGQRPALDLSPFAAGRFAVGD